MDVDVALSNLGKYRRWHILNFVALGLTFQLPYSINFVSMMFTDYKPAFECIQQTDNNATCAIYSNGSYLPCSGGWHFPNFTGSTIVTEWQLLCDKGNMVSASQTVLFVGYVIGIFLTSFPTDKFGRRTMCLYSTIGLGVVVTLSSLSPNYTVFTFSRFFVGFFCGGMNNGGFTLLNETFPSHGRSFGGILIATFWSIAVCILSLLAYFVENWRHLQLCLGLYCFLVLPLFRFIRESVLWDISKGRVDKAEETLKIAAKMNRITFPEPILKRYDLVIVENDQESEVTTPSKKLVSEGMKDNACDLVRNRIMFIYLVSSIAIGFGIAMIYYSFLLSTPVMHGNRFLNTFLGSLAEMPAYFVIYLTSQRFGRKKPFQFLLFASAVLSFLGVYFEVRRAEHATLSHYTIVTIIILSKMTLTASSALCNLYISEIFPTTIRARSTGISTMFGKSATFFSVYSVRYMERAAWLCFLTYGCMLFLLATLFFYLPETHNRKLPSTVEEACNMRKKRSPKPMIIDTEEKCNGLLR